MLTYEREVQRAKNRRALGYALLWLFLAVMVWFISTYTGRHYPMDGLVALGLALIGLIKLVYGIRYLQETKDSRPKMQDDLAKRL